MKRPCRAEFIQSHARRCKFKLLFGAAAAAVAAAAVAAAMQTSACIEYILLVFAIVCVGVVVVGVVWPTVCLCVCCCSRYMGTMHPLFVHEK